MPGWARPLTFTPDGNNIVALSGGHEVQFLDTKTGKLTSDIRPDDPDNLERWNDISIAPQANLLAIGGIDAEKRGIVEVWDLSAATAK